MKTLRSKKNPAIRILTNDAKVQRYGIYSQVKDLILADLLLEIDCAPSHSEKWFFMPFGIEYGQEPVFNSEEELKQSVKERYEQQ